MRRRYYEDEVARRRERTRLDVVPHHRHSTSGGPGSTHSSRSDLRVRVSAGSSRSRDIVPDGLLAFTVPYQSVPSGIRVVDVVTRRYASTNHSKAQLQFCSNSFMINF